MAGHSYTAVQRWLVLVHTAESVVIVDVSPPFPLCPHIRRQPMLFGNGERKFELDRQKPYGNFSPEGARSAILQSAFGRLPWHISQAGASLPSQRLNSALNIWGRLGCSSLVHEQNRRMNAGAMTWYKFVISALTLAIPPVWRAVDPLYRHLGPLFRHCSDADNLRVSSTKVGSSCYCDRMTTNGREINCRHPHRVLDVSTR